MDRSVAIIGAGIGGLSSGVKLAQQGTRVTLFEKEVRPGGYAVDYRRRGYRFDLALHVVPSGGAGQEFSSMVNSLGLSNDIQFIKLKQGFNVVLGDYRFQMPNSYDELFDELKSAFPATRDKLNHFRRDLEKHVNSYAPLFDYTVPKYRSVPSFLTKIPAFLKHSMMSTRDYLEQFFDDPKIMAILFQPAAFMGIPMSDFPTVNFMMMFYLLMKNGMYTIAGGGQSLTDGLREKFHQFGGRLVTNTEVTNIIIENKKAVALHTDDGTQHQCDTIIAANNIYDLVNRLVGRSHFPQRYLQNLNALKPSISVLALNLGIDCHPEDLGIEPHITMFFPEPDIDQCMNRQQKQIEMDGFSITAHCNSDPDFSSNGQYSLSLVGGTDPNKWLAMNDRQYRNEKERIIKETIDKADSLFPGLEKHVRLSDLATPRTMQRYTGNPQGAIMGFNCTCGSHRMIMKAANIPIENIIIGGAWTNRLGGFMQSMKSGILAAESISQ